jgi:hypothetical protein
MPEIIEEDPLVGAFTKFRLESRDEIMPPGTSAARRTLSRRRAIRVAASATLAVAGVVGGVLVAANTLGTPPPPPGATSGPDVGPTRSDVELEQLAEEALATLWPGVKPTVVPPGTVFGPVTESSSSFTYQLGTDAQPFPKGTYQLRATCVGRGSVFVRWRSAAADGSETVNCGKGIQLALFRLTAPDVITISFVPDAVAKGRAGVAVSVTDPRAVAAVAALGPPTENTFVAGYGYADGVREDRDDADVVAGTYKAIVACVGAGHVKLTLSIGAATTSTTSDCTLGGASSTVSLRATSGGPMRVRIEPDGVALNNAGFAYRIVQV